MSDIWPPRRTSIADGTITTVTTSYRWGSITSVRSTKQDNLASVRGTKSRLGTNTRGFTELARTGNLPMTYLNFEETSIGSTVGSTTTLSKATLGYQTGVRVSGNGFGPVIPSGVVFGAISNLRAANLENKVKQQVSANMKGQDINIAQAFAERDQTVRLIATSLTRIAKARRALASGNFLGAAQALGLSITKKLRTRAGAWSQTQDLSRGWLELQYGWRPLVQDIYGAASVLRKSHVDSQYQVFHARSSINDTIVDTYNSSLVNAIATTSVTMSMKVTLKVRRSSPVLGSLGSMGLTNPLTIAWELTPYSFVVDWALPIGSFISQLDASLGYTFAGACLTTFVKSSYRATDFGPATLPPGYAVYTALYSQSAEKVKCFRVGISGFGDLISLPYFKDPRSATHVANALALLAVKR